MIFRWPGVVIDSTIKTGLLPLIDNIKCALISSIKVVSANHSFNPFGTLPTSRFLRPLDASYKIPWRVTSLFGIT